MAIALRETYQLKVVLSQTKPQIWRRFLIESVATLEDLHDTLQMVMGWTDIHSHQFTMAERLYGSPEIDWEGEDVRDETKSRLSAVFTEVQEVMMYEYDFGDDWEHLITLEKILPFDLKHTLPRCIKAKGACPPEDVGGVLGYKNFLAALADKAHPEHQQYIEWYGKNFDRDDYDIDLVNYLLLQYFE